jgi:hypothetical protein
LWAGFFFLDLNSEQWLPFQITTMKYVCSMRTQIFLTNWATVTFSSTLLFGIHQLFQNTYFLNFSSGPSAPSRQHTATYGVPRVGVISKTDFICCQLWNSILANVFFSTQFHTEYLHEQSAVFFYGWQEKVGPRPQTFPNRNCSCVRYISFLKSWPQRCAFEKLRQTC